MNSRWIVLNALRNIEDIHSRKHKPGRIQRWNDEGTEWWRDWMIKGLNDEGTEWSKDWMRKSWRKHAVSYAGETTTGNRDKAILDRQLSLIATLVSLCEI